MTPWPRLSRTDVDAARDAAQRVVQTHERLGTFLRIGQTLAEIDRFVARTLDELGCKSCFLGYKVAKSPAFPSYACLSLNECVVHGTAGYVTRALRPGDLLKIDIGVSYKGWIGDAAWTYCYGEPDPEVRRLMECGRESLRRGITRLQPGEPYIHWAQEVQRCVEVEAGFHLVRGLGGHGYGRKLHAPPFVSNVVPSTPGEWPDAFSVIKPGTLLAVEPMIAMGTGDTIQHRHEWPIYTADGSLAVHYEHDVLITEEGPEILTEGLDELQDVVREG